MAKVKFQLNHAGVRELMRSSQMQAVCAKYASGAVGRLGAGYEMNTFVGENRVNAEVAAVTFKARKENLSNNTILKSLRG